VLLLKSNCARRQAAETDSERRSLALILAGAAPTASSSSSASGVVPLCPQELGVANARVSCKEVCNKGGHPEEEERRQKTRTRLKEEARCRGLLSEREYMRGGEQILRTDAHKDAKRDRCGHSGEG